MKTILVVVSTYNEEENAASMANAVISLFEQELKDYELEFIFIDNCSKENIKVILRQLCKNDECIKCIFSAKNLGSFNSPYYGLT